jgi:hypothetical protein
MPDCSEQRIPHLSAWQCVGDSLDDVWMHNFDYFDAKTCNLEFSARLWESAYTTVSSFSARWEDVRTTVNNNSGDWVSLYTTVCGNSGFWAGPISLIYPCPFIETEFRTDTVQEFITLNFPASNYISNIEFYVYWPEWNQHDDYTPQLIGSGEPCSSNCSVSSNADTYVFKIPMYIYKNINNIWVQQT